jgi:hypothetical protein
VNAEFNWWLLIVGLVVGAGLVWLVVADSRRREADVSELEREGEARWIASTMSDAGRRLADADVLDVLRLHAAYLAASPPDEPEGEDPERLDVEDAPGAADDDRWVPVGGQPATSAPSAPPAPSAPSEPSVSPR